MSYKSAQLVAHVKPSTMKRSTRAVRSARGARLVAAASAGCSFEGAPPCDDTRSGKPKTGSSAVECADLKKNKNRRSCSQRKTRSASSTANSAAAQDVPEGGATASTAGGGRPGRRDPSSHHSQKGPTPSARGGKKRGAPAPTSAADYLAPAAIGTTPGKALGTAVALGSLASPKRRQKTVKAATAGRRQGKEQSEQHTTTGGEVSLVDREAAMLATLLSPIAGREPRAESEDQVRIAITSGIL